MATTSLFSSFRNTSGTKMHFGFLGSHGATLDVGAGYTVFGDIYDHIVGRRGKARSVAAFQAALNNGLLTMDRTPAVVLYDAGNVNAKALNLASGTLGTVDPGWGAYSGAA